MKNESTKTDADVQKRLGHREDRASGDTPDLTCCEEQKG